MEGSPLQAAGFKALLTSLSSDLKVVAVTTALSTLKRNLHTILTKLKVSNRVGAATYAARAGLI